MAGENMTLLLILFTACARSPDLRIIDALIRRLEQNHDVIAVFCIGAGDADLGARPGNEVIDSYFAGRIDLLINLQSVTSRNTQETAQTFVTLMFHHPSNHHLQPCYDDWMSGRRALLHRRQGGRLSFLGMGMTSMIPMMRSRKEPAGGT